MSAQEVVCGLAIEACHCVLPWNHDGPHECDCGGSWEGDQSNYVPLTYPERAGLYPRGRRQAVRREWRENRAG